MIPPALASLPVNDCLPDLAAALAGAGTAVLCAEPGAGKSTLVPLAILDAPWLGNGRILMLQPRKVAAVALAWRMARSLGQEAGGLVGYRVRLDSCTGPSTRLEVITEGILGRMLQEDPSLEGVGAVIFDEFHERSLHADLALSMCIDARESLRPDLRILVMSATMDTGAVAGILGQVRDGLRMPAPVVSGGGRLFPVMLDHRAPPAGSGYWQHQKRFCAWAASVIGETLNEREGDILVFLPGRREIELVRQGLETPGLPCEVRALHGSIPLREQASILERGSRRRVILSTSLAETSLTIPGISMVIDAGISRFDRFDLRLGMDRLVSERVSAFSAAQRAGRAGRLGPGWCLRLWDAHEQLPQALPPDIARSDLAGFALDALVWGARSARDLHLASPVSEPLWNEAVEVLEELGLAEPCDGGYRASASGRKAASLGIHPRLGAMLLGAAGGQGLLTACVLAAVLEDGASTLREGGDLTLMMGAVVETGLREGAQGPFFRRVAALGARLGLSLRGPADLAAWDASALPGLLTGALPDRVGRRLAERDEDRTGRGTRYQLVSGRQALLPGSGGPGWLVVVDAEAGDEYSRIQIHMGLPDSTQEDLLDRSRSETRVDWSGLVPRLRTLRTFGRLVLKDGPGNWAAPDARKAIASSLRSLVHSKGLEILPWSDRSTMLLYRLRFANRQGLSLAVDPGAQGLLAGLEDWLGAFVRLEPGRPVLDEDRLVQALEALCPWDRKKDLDRLAPASVALPSGRQRSLEYGPEGTEQPVLSLRIQEAFGYRTHPMAGSVPLLLHLLSPARRPLQITSDLPGFWAGSYQDVRKDMRGRYPKHAWPENPHEVVDE